MRGSTEGSMPQSNETTRVTCGPGQVGPFPVWTEENMVESRDPYTGKIRTKDVCLDARYVREPARGGDRGIFTTRYLEVNGPAFETSRPDRWNYLWLRESPNFTDPHFDTLFVAWTIEQYISHLSGLGLPQAVIDTIFPKTSKIPVEITETPYPRARHMTHGGGLLFGYQVGRFNMGGDADIVIHEFRHLVTEMLNSEFAHATDNKEGEAIKEALSDIAAALYHMDPEIGEDVVRYYNKNLTQSPETGLRTVSELEQLPLIPHNESHKRSLIYSSFLWSCYQKLVELTGTREKARDIMTVLTIQMTPHIPPKPVKKDFIVAFLRALDDFTNDREMQRRYSFNVESFLSTVRTEARANQIVISFDEFDSL